MAGQWLFGDNIYLFRGLYSSFKDRDSRWWVLILSLNVSPLLLEEGCDMVTQTLYLEGAPSDGCQILFSTSSSSSLGRDKTVIKW